MIFNFDYLTYNIKKMEYFEPNKRKKVTKELEIYSSSFNK